jgi:hypothetical protein
MARYPGAMIADNLWSKGYASLGRVLAPAACNSIRALYDDGRLFRSTIDMARYRFGRGQYRYFADPVPDQVADLRARYYEELAPIACEWMSALRMPFAYPATHDAFLAHCKKKGQARPTPLLLRYRAGDYNCLHQDLYGPIAFPFQVIVSLSEPEEEFSGGALLLVEQRPRAQSVGHSLALGKGEAVAITTRYRPAKSARGFARTNFRHGVSEITRGERMTLGLIFHDAE